MDTTLEQDLNALRAMAPLVHNITNYVVMNYSANALLSIGASPVMAHAIEEVEEMAGIAGALVINIGTLSAPWVQAMKLAMKKAADLGKPIVLDPVGAGATGYRNTVLSELLETAAPTVIRGNASEILALAGLGGQTKGVDSTASSMSSLDAAHSLSERLGCVVSVSGAIDVIVQNDRVAYVENGHPLMTKVTGMGCSASAIAGAFCAVQPDSFQAAVSAAAAMGVCGQLAFSKATAPGSFQIAFLDALAELAPEKLVELARIR
ncbi:hydroxyethylthiazole kinase [Larkinella sp.]|uniref:hydroxyethylthiazole kinase n=1 Tax=Larkinella sp. TaxID=2034517 RepID=UPI003BAC079B